MNPNRLASVLISSAIIIAGLIYFKDILRPFAVAMFLWLIIDGLANFLAKFLKFLPRATSVPTAVILVFVALGFLAMLVAQYTKEMAQDIFSYRERLDAAIFQIYQNFNLGAQAPTTAELFAKISPSTILNGIGEAVKDITEESILIFIFVVGLFAAQSSLKAKADAIFINEAKRSRAQAISNAIKNSIEKYLWVQTIVGIGISAICYVIFMALHIEHAVFWTVLTFVLSYIPVLGGWVATILPMIFALVQFPTPLEAFLILILTHAVQFVAVNFVQPKMAGDSLNISVLVIFISLAFWGSVWGWAGMFLAVPLAVMIMLILAQFNETRSVAIMMSAHGNPDIGIDD